MQVQFHGAAGEVTGSMYLVQAAGRRILLECGLVQGGRDADTRNAAPFPFEPSELDVLVLSHAHIDHTGRVPLLVQRGFRGAIIVQQATASLLPVMLLDSASLAAGDAERANRKRRPGETEVAPLFTPEDVAATMAQVRGVPYDAPIEACPGVELLFRDAGHILGSCIVELRADGRSLVFSGDLGQPSTPILRDPVQVRQADLVVMESTYGDRNHRPRTDTMRELGEIFALARREGGNVCIPAFAVGRSQELLYLMAQHWDEWGIDRWQIFLDSPMAQKVVAVYDRHEDLFDAQARSAWSGARHPFRLPNLHMTASTQESMAINNITGGAIIIAGSGMCNGGRILHHLKQNLPRRNAHVVFIGYQAEGTLGRRLVDGAPWVRIHGRDYRVNASRHTVGGLSAHADQQGLLAWYGGFDGHPPVVLVHGEDTSREALAGELGERHGVHARLARPGMHVEV